MSKHNRAKARGKHQGRHKNLGRKLIRGSRKSGVVEEVCPEQSYAQVRPSDGDSLLYVRRQHVSEGLREGTYVSFLVDQFGDVFRLKVEGQPKFVATQKTTKKPPLVPGRDLKKAPQGNECNLRQKDFTWGRIVPPREDDGDWFVLIEDGKILIVQDSEVWRDLQRLVDKNQDLAGRQIGIKIGNSVRRRVKIAVSWDRMSGLR